MKGARPSAHDRRPTPHLWRHREITTPLVSLAYLERATAHILLGWLPKVETLGIKIVLGKHQHADMTLAARLERVAWAATRLHAAGPPPVARRLKTLMQGIDASADGAELLTRLYLGVKAALLGRYQALIAKADPVLDAGLLEALEAAQAEAEGQLAWAQQVLGRKTSAERAAVTRLLTRPSRGPNLAREKWLWRPIERVPLCARPAELRFGQKGESNVVLSGPPASESWIGDFFHHIAGSEICTMEFYGRCSYEHPDLPEEFHHDYSRVTSDEARHAEIGLRFAAEMGRPYGTLSIDTSLYDALYQYAPCRAGSKQELIWRLLLQGTFREGLVIEGFELQAKKMRHGRMREVADVTEKMAAEEIDHIAFALKWTRRLLGGDPDRVKEERARAHAWYVALANQARREYVAKDPDAAIAETEERWRYARKYRKKFPFSSTLFVNRTARKAAGYTQAEIDQVIQWGYLQP